VNGVSGSILLNKSIIARLLDLLGNLADSVVPRDIFPICSPRSPHLASQEPALIQDVLLERCSLGAKRSAINRMIGVTLDVHHLRRHVLGAVPNGVDNHAAAHRAVLTCRPRLI